MKETKRVVIFRLGSMGDTVVALPCFHSIAKSFPDAERVVLTNFPVSSKAAALELILKNGGFIHSSIGYPVSTRNIGVLWKLSRALRALNADTMIYLTAARGLVQCYRDAAFFRLCGFRRIIGLPFTRELQSNRIDANGTVEHECLRLARCMSELGEIDIADPANWDLRLTEQEKLAGQSCIQAFGGRAYVSINMGGKDPSKDWGIENWRSLMTRVNGVMPGCGLLVVGAAEDAMRVEQVSQGWNGPVVNACGTLLPRESGAAMAGSTLFVGHDSGPLHLAAAMGVACVGLFGNFNQPKKWYPVGEQHRIIHNLLGIEHITIDEVLEAVTQVLRQASGV